MFAEASHNHIQVDYIVQVYSKLAQVGLADNWTAHLVVHKVANSYPQDAEEQVDLVKRVVAFRFLAQVAGEQHCIAKVSQIAREKN